MASITIRNLDDEVKTRLRVRAAENGRSMEDEARAILGEVLPARDAPIATQGSSDFYAAAREIFEPIGGMELDIRPRQRMRPLPDFSGPEFGTYDDE
jgi:plasmid stability protein